MPTATLLDVHLSSTLFMSGLIWFVQLVHYPMFADVGHSAFVSYARTHQIRTTRVVLLPMLVELGTGIWLCLTLTGTSQTIFALSFGILIAIWASTALLQVPCHTRLVKQREEETIHRLVKTNWIRTLGWSARSAILLWLVSTP